MNVCVCVCVFKRELFFSNLRSCTHPPTHPPVCVLEGVPKKNVFQRRTCSSCATCSAVPTRPRQRQRPHTHQREPTHPPPTYHPPAHRPRPPAHVHMNARSRARAHTRTQPGGLLSLFLFLSLSFSLSRSLNLESFFLAQLGQLEQRPRHLRYICVPCVCGSKDMPCT